MKPSVLIVDDDPSVRQSISKVLEAEGYQVQAAADSEEAHKVDAHSVNVLLLDINLPPHSGWDVFERMTTNNPFISVVVITGQEQQFPMATAAGVDALMEKPLDVPALLATLKSLLTESKEDRLRRMAGQGGEPRYVPPENGPIADKLRERLNKPFRFSWALPRRHLYL